MFLCGSKKPKRAGAVEDEKENESDKLRAELTAVEEARKSRSRLDWSEAGA